MEAQNNDKLLPEPQRTISNLSSQKNTKYILYDLSLSVLILNCWSFLINDGWRERKRHTERGKQSDYYLQFTATTDWTGDKWLEREQSQLRASVWCCSLMKLALWQGSYFRHTDGWWLFSGLSWFRLAIRIITRCCHHPLWAHTHHWRAVQRWHIPLQASCWLEQCWTRNIFFLLSFAGWCQI